MRGKHLLLQRHEHPAPLAVHLSCNVDNKLVPLGSARLDMRGVPGCPQRRVSDSGGAGADTASGGRGESGGGEGSMVGRTDAELEELCPKLPAAIT